MSDNVPVASLNSALAAILNGERVRADLTFDALAEASGISKRTLMRLLSTNERDIDVPVLETLADRDPSTLISKSSHVQQGVNPSPTRCRSRSRREEVVRNTSWSWRPW